MQRIGVNRESAARAVDESQRSFFELGYDQAIAFPGIFTQFFDALGHFHRTAELDGLESGLIYLFGDRDHHARAHVVSPQALLAVAQGRIDKTNFGHSYLIAQRPAGLNRLSGVARWDVIETVEKFLSPSTPSFGAPRAWARRRS